MRLNENRDEIRNLLVELLAIIYARVPWGKMRTRHNVHDIFNHRVRAAARKANINEFVSKLCNYFGLQDLPPESIDAIQDLQEHQTRALDLLYKEHIPICVMSIMHAKQIKEIKKAQKKVQKDLFIEGEQ